MRINIDRAIDAVREANAAYYDYTKASKVYRDRHGVGVNFDRIKTKEERQIEYYYHANNRAIDALYMVCEVLDLDKEQRQRLYTMGKAFEKWYNRTGWEKLPNNSMLTRASRFIEEG